MIFFDIFRKLFYYKRMSSNNDNWKSIIANPGVIETSFGSISFLPPVQNTNRDFIHPPIKINSVGKAKYVQYSKGEKNE